MELYVSIVPNSQILQVQRRGDNTVQSAVISLDGQRLTLFNGGPMFKFNESISLSVSCETQDEIDALWARLCEGGTPGRCGWLKDRFGLSWQIVPRDLGALLGHPDPEVAGRVFQVMLTMGRLDVAKLRAASSS